MDDLKTHNHQQNRSIQTTKEIHLLSSDVSDNEEADETEETQETGESDDNESESDQSDHGGLVDCSCGSIGGEEHCTGACGRYSY